MINYGEDREGCPQTESLYRDSTVTRDFRWFWVTFFLLGNNKRDLPIIQTVLSDGPPRLGILSGEQRVQGIVGTTRDGGIQGSFCRFQDY